MKELLKGLPASPGTMRGRVFVALTSALVPDDDWEVLVVPFSTPLYYSLLLRARALVTDYGGVTSHAAQIARELAIPAVVGTGCATELLSTGMDVIVDGTSGVVHATVD